MRFLAIYLRFTQKMPYSIDLLYGEYNSGMNNAGGRTRTDMSQGSLDFESSAYTDFTTPAEYIFIVTYLSENNKCKIRRSCVE